MAGTVPRGSDLPFPILPIAPKAIDKADLLAHAAVGLDPTGELSRQLVREAILPVLDQCDPSSCVASRTIALHLRVAEPEARALARALVKRMESEQDSDALWRLGDLGLRCAWPG